MAGGKAHSEWSASASARNMACPGALTLINSRKLLSETSIFAAWGTVMHDIIERSLASKSNPVRFLGAVVKCDGYDIEVDEEMVDAATVCADYVTYIGALPGAQTWLEEQFDLSPLGFQLQAGGTSDAVVWMPADRTLEIVDYKGGRGKVVEIHDNTQLPHYGLGAVLKHPELPVKTVKMTIIQPRIEHADGAIRSIEWHVSDLIDFANDIAKAIDRSVTALANFHAGEVEAWGEQWLHPGDHCQFCPAAGSCPALRKQSQEMVNLHWNDATPVLTSTMSPDAVEQDLEVLDLMEHWISERRAYAHQLAEGGHQFAGWVLVEKNGHRKWNAPDKETAKAIVTATKLSELELFTQKLKSPAQVEKTLGKAKEKIAGLYHTPIIGKDLVRRSKAGSRQPAQSLVDQFFNLAISQEPVK
jgi:hypothetical protein